MKKHHTKNKGDLGVLKAKYEAYKQGYGVLIPLAEHESFDFVAYKDNKFIRIQVKARTKTNCGSLIVAFRNIWSDKKGIHIKNWDKMEFDVLCLYDLESEECYFISMKTLEQDKECFSLRVDKPKNNQFNKINFSENYKLIPE